MMFHSDHLLPALGLAAGVAMLSSSIHPHDGCIETFTKN